MLDHMEIGWQLWAFMSAIVLFHSSEFLLAAIYMRHELSIRSLLITKPYMMAMAAGLAEYALEASLWGSVKQQPQWVSVLGLLMMIIGELMRKTAMVTAASNFTHDIAREQRDGHVLITKGIYRFVRHPGYLGWFMWSVGTQVLLVNPLCTIAFACVSWRFFAVRIPFEEWYLKQFFGQEYLLYEQSTPSGIPFIP